MSLERPQGPHEQNEKLSEAQQEIAALENTKAQLELVRESLVMERKGGNQARYQQARAERAIDAASDEVISAGMKSDDAQPDHSPLKQAMKDKDVADESVRIFTETPSMSNVHGHELEDGALKEKLEKLGVDLEADKFTTNPKGMVDTAIGNRLSELDAQIREKKLNVTGGKEEMTLEVLRSANLLDAAYLKDVTYQLERFTNALNDPPSAQTILSGLAIESTPARWYPKEVQKSVAWQMLKAAAGGVNERKIPETMEKLKQLRPEIDSLIDAK